MLKIRLTRVGRKHDPSFRIVVTDSRKPPRSGACLENLGFYNPRKIAGKSSLELKRERIGYWISKGAQVSGVVHNLFIGAGLMEGKKINVSRTKKRKTEEEKGEEEKAAVA